MKQFILFIALCLMFNIVKAQWGLNGYGYSPSNPKLGDTLKIYSSFDLFNGYNMNSPCGALNKLENHIINSSTLRISFFLEDCYHLGAVYCNRKDTAEFLITSNSITQLEINWYVRDSFCSNQFPYTKIDSATVLFNSTRINEVNETLTFSIYPNPVKGKLYFKGHQNELPEKIWLYNSQGLLLREENLIHNEIDTEGLASGIYFLRIKYKGSLEQLKFIKE